MLLINAPSKMVTKRQVTAYKKKHIVTTNDVALHAPKAYRDYRTVYHELTPEMIGHHVAIAGTLTYCDIRYKQKTYVVIRIQTSEENGFTVMMFSDTHLYHKYRAWVNRRVVACGQVAHDDQYGFSLRDLGGIYLEEEFSSGIEIAYPAVGGVSDATLRKHIDWALKGVQEPLDAPVVSAFGMMPYADALWNLHHPDCPEKVRAAKVRLVLNDLIYLALALGLGKHRSIGTTLTFKERSEMDDFIKGLPFGLTRDQMDVIERFARNAAAGVRNNILLQGDVGCGKTVVAVAMMVLASKNGYQSVLMAPREVLARQHYNGVAEYLAGAGISCVHLHSGMKAAERADALERIASGEARVIVGTHSCLADAVNYHRLGLVITDEEHLFGVRQKELLEEKAEEGVHCVSMSATPIPRTLAGVLYGDDKEIQEIKTMPAGRLPVKTYRQIGHEKVFPFVLSLLKKQQQCYVVCPAIEENKKIEIVSIESIEKEYRNYFEPCGFSVGIVNGKMDKEEIAETMQKFEAGEHQILLSTTVIEVGVNVPNSTVMIIEQAERFGLASLHQLRGRVGRGNLQSYCFLLSDQLANPRLATMVATNDGFEIAEADLAQRGSGDFVGTKQAGQNAYIDEMLRYPRLFARAVEIAGYCRENGYGSGLIDLYAEHELADVKD